MSWYHTTNADSTCSTRRFGRFNERIRAQARVVVGLNYSLEALITPLLKYLLLMGYQNSIKGTLKVWNFYMCT